MDFRLGISPGFETDTTQQTADIGFAIAGPNHPKIDALGLDDIPVIVMTHGERKKTGSIFDHFYTHHAPHIRKHRRHDLIII